MKPIVLYSKSSCFAT